MLKFKKMGSDKVPLLLVTANVGSIFEDPSVMLPIWTSEFLQAVSRMDPKFIALHLQEVGGKTYEKSMQYVQEFVQRLCDCPELRLYDKIRIFLDEDFSSPEKFTALGNMYFAHTSLTDIKIWDFELKAYVDALGKEVHTGNIEKVTTKEKAKFPQHFFPECKWSRKGFLRTRWWVRGTALEFINIHLFHDASNLQALEPYPSCKWSRKGFLRTRWWVRGTALEFINIHLFHDASNLQALEPYPSVYCRSRRRALRHTLRHLHSDVNAAPYFIFGDFNFRTDTGGVVKKITEDLTACRLQDSAKVDSSRLQYKCKSDDRLVLTIGKKEFAHAEHQKIFREPWLQRYDRELEALRPHLYEFPVKFPPSYPFEEDVHLPTHYMKTRCPAWCDRILLSQSARLLVQQDPARPGENRHLHTSRKSVADSTDSSGRVSSSDSSPARSGSPHSHTQGSPAKTLEKKNSVVELDALSVTGFNVSRKSIADPTSLQKAINARAAESEMSASGQRRKLVRNQSEGAPKGEALSAELRRLVDAAPARKRTEYAVMGPSTCMGDHKPIYLRVLLQSDRGTLHCCSNSICSLTPTLLPRHRLPTFPDLTKLPPTPYAPAPNGLPPEIRRTGSLNETLLRIPHVEITTVDSPNGIFVNEVDSALLCVRPLIDPYTPESVDSRSPIETEIVVEPEIADRTVSPTQLKHRLDKLIVEKTAPELRRLNSRESCKSEGSRKGVCFALKCYGFCRRKASKVRCGCKFSCCTS